jgi:protein-L-isoaspartate(D-aspartate) O-methyltransferase
MVETQLAARGIGDDRVLAAMEAVPREDFVPADLVEFAYRDSPLPIGSGQTISQPFIVALMLEALAPREGERALEVGAGSGYAAAVLAELVDEVFAVERHGPLARATAQRLDELGIDTVHIRHGDGTLGWEEHAPYDVILVSAGGAEVPEALEEQLAPGGRLVIPVGDPEGHQELHLLTRNPSGDLDLRNLGGARFVPLVGSVAPDPGEAGGAHAPEPDGESRARSTAPPTAVDRLRRRAEPFASVGEAEVDAVRERLSGHAVVLLGEASHGTSEFYRLRARLTRELIEAGEADFVALEADWPDAAHLDRWVRGREAPGERPDPFTRFPRWMWANEETLEFLRWLRAHNESRREGDRVAIHGLDLYALHTSIGEVLDYLDEVDPDAAQVARARYGCLTPWEQEPQTYGQLVTSGRFEACTDDVVAVLGELLERRLDEVAADGERFFDAVQNARLVANAEGYYRAMYRSSTASWNLRDQHMFDVLDALVEHHGPDGTGVAWAHNSHLGDASATEMGAGGQHNLGQLSRARWGGGCYTVGFGTHTGTVRAASEWGGTDRAMKVTPSLEGSWERLGHDTELNNFFLPLRANEGVRRALSGERLQRAIGVIYRPETERHSHYFHAALPRQFDEWVFLDRTTALTPLTSAPPVAGGQGDVVGEPAETFPFAV